MNEIYWITRLDPINNAALTIMIISIVISLFALILYFIFNGQVIYDNAKKYDDRVKEFTGYKNTCRNILRYSIPLSVIGCLLMIFVPTTKEALLIYGVGGTIDYVRSNPVAKQIPDKCIIALDKWVDSLSNDSTENKK